MALRSDWTVQVAAESLAETCRNRADYHDGRAGFWDDERALVEAEIKKTGMEIRTYQQTGGDRHEAVIDPTLSRRLSECQSKISSHQAKTLEYQRWVPFLEAQGDSILTLDQNDFFYFQANPEEPD